MHPEVMFPSGIGAGEGLRVPVCVCELCVIIVLSSEAPMGALTKREHSPWWVTQQWPARSRLWQGRLLCSSVLIVFNLPIAQSQLTFYRLLLFPQISFFFPPIFFSRKSSPFICHFRMLEMSITCCSVRKGRGVIHAGMDAPLGRPSGLSWSSLHAKMDIVCFSSGDGADVSRWFIAHG